MNEKDGVTITLREIYDSLQEVGASVKGVDARLAVLENQNEKVSEADERSRKALEQSTIALALAQRHDDNLKWVWRAVIGASITAIITGFAGLFFMLIQTGIIGGK